MIKTSKNIMRRVIPPYILKLRLNNHVHTVLFWHTNIWLLCISWLIFSQPSKPPQIWQPLLLNKIVQVILYLNKIFPLSYLLYNLHHLLDQHPKVFCVSCNNYILNILYLHFQYQLPLSQREFIHILLVCCWSVSKTLLLSSEEPYPHITQKPLHHTLFILFASYVSPFIFSSLASFSTSTTNSFLDYLIIPSYPW